MLALGHRLTDDDLVFCDDAGEPLWGRHVTTLQLKALLRRAGLPSIRFHELRHTFATLQLMAGTNPKIVSVGRGDDAPPVAASDRGSHKGSRQRSEATIRPDPSVDRADEGESGTAYRNRGDRPAGSS